MTLFCRNGRWYVRYKKRKLSLHTKDSRMAQTIYAQLVVKALDEELSFCIHNKPLLQVQSQEQINVKKNKPKAKHVLVENVFQDYIKMMQLKNVTEHTIYFKQKCFELIQSCGVKYFTDYNQENINKFVEKIKHYSVDTQRKYITDMFAFLHNCVKKGYITDRLVNSFDLPKTRSKARELIISDQDWELILIYTKENDIDFYYYLLTLFNTFSRPSEIVKLKGSDFHLEDRHITIFQNKTQKNKRVFLYEDFCDEMQKLIDNNGKETLFEGAKHGLEFYSKKFKKLIAKLELDNKYTLYTIRHTSITYLMNKTNDVEFVAKQAGDSPEIILKHYINRKDEHYLKLMEK